MLIRGWRVGLVLTALFLSAGCATRRAAAPEPPEVPVGAYVDLVPGWRVRVITPLLRSGRFLLERPRVSGSGADLTVQTADEVLGVETADYAVARHGAGVTVTLAGVSPGLRPVHPLFAFPRRLRHVRLVYLERGPASSHAMAVLAAAHPRYLPAATAAARREDCAVTRQSACVWVPAGIAVRPEQPRGNGWVPAR